MLEKLRELLGEYIELTQEEITCESKLIEDLGLNSYEFMSLIGELEEEFDIEVDERDVLRISTVGEVIEYITELQV